MFEKVLQFLRSQIGKVALIAFLLGVLFGWFVIGWGIWPVEWTNAGFVDLQEDYAELAMKNAVNAYAATGNEQTALHTYLGFGNIAEDTYLSVKESGELSPDALIQFEALLEESGNQPSGSTISQTSEEDEEPVGSEVEDITQPLPDDEMADAADGAEENPALRRIGTFIGVLFVLLLVGGLVLAYIFLVPEDTKISIRTLLTKHPRPENQTREPLAEETPPYLSSMETNEDYDYQVGLDEEPYMDEEPVITTSANEVSEPRLSPIVRTVNYAHNDAGRSHLDQNFSLKDDNNSGKTVLEYGVAMSDYVEIGGVTYALAFDVYLASHPERRTITRVLVNKDLLNHPEVLQRYEGKGEPIRIDQDYVFQLQTAKFRLNGSIVTADYVFDESYGGNYLQAMEVDLLIHYL